MNLEAIVLLLVAAPLVYLLIWGLGQGKLSQYNSAWREIWRRWDKRDEDLLRIIKEQHKQQNSTESSFVRRSSIENNLMPMERLKDCVIES
jgi:hypothetical protein